MVAAEPRELGAGSAAALAAWSGGAQSREGSFQPCFPLQLRPGGVTDSTEGLRRAGRKKRDLAGGSGRARRRPRR